MSFRADGDFRYDGVWRKVRAEVLERDGWICQIRGPKCRVAATQVDHIVSWRAGGALYDPANLRAACQPCNGGRTFRQAKRRPSREW